MSGYSFLLCCCFIIVIHAASNLCPIIDLGPCINQYTAWKNNGTCTNGKQPQRRTCAATCKCNETLTRQVACPTTTKKPATKKTTTKPKATTTKCKNQYTAWKVFKKCTDTCGLCGTRVDKRTCKAGCTCTGALQRTVRCTDAVCIFPRPQSCCVGTKKIVNQAFKCVA